MKLHCHYLEVINKVIVRQRRTLWSFLRAYMSASETENLQPSFNTAAVSQSSRLSSQMPPLFEDMLGSPSRTSSSNNRTKVTQNVFVRTVQHGIHSGLCEAIALAQQNIL